MDRWTSTRPGSLHSALCLEQELISLKLGRLWLHASLTAIRLIFSIAAHCNTCILHADVPNAFCQGDLDTRALLQLPKGVSLEDDEGNSSIIVLLRKALYGLRQSPQLFSKLLNELLSSCGLQRCEQEACIYKYYGADGWILIGCEVDDLIVTGTNEKKLRSCKRYSRTNGVLNSGVTFILSSACTANTIGVRGSLSLTLSKRSRACYNVSLSLPSCHTRRFHCNRLK